MSAEVLQELRNWIHDLEISKIEAFAVFIAFMLLWNIRAILEALNARHAINREFQLKDKKLTAQIRRELERRKGKKGGK